MPHPNGRRPRIGLVLGGGGAAGIAHVGVLQALDRAGIKPDFVVGTSMGALIGASYCCGNDVYSMESRARELSWKDVAPLTIPRMMGLIPSENIRRLYLRYAKVETFAQLKIPLAVIVTDLRKGERLIVQDGNLADAVQASCAIPGVFTPVKVGDRLLVDGGVLSNLPVDVARSLGADIVIASDIDASMTSPDQIANAMHVVSQSMFLMIRKLADLAAQDADFVIRTAHPEATIMNFAISRELVRSAREQTDEMIPALQARIAGFGRDEGAAAGPDPVAKGWSELFFGTARLSPI